MARNRAFPEAQPLKFTASQEEEVLSSLVNEYKRKRRDRERWNANHAAYDDMFRGRVPDRTGPWPGAANLHVQMPFWLVDSINTRLVTAVWDQVPLVGGQPENDEDVEAFRRARHSVDWHAQEKRMNARALWARASKIRLIHGFSTSLLSYAQDTYTYRRFIEGGTALPRIQDGRVQVDDEGEVVRDEPEATEWHTATKYDGPVLYPLEYDDVVAPVDCMNLQPLSPSNPGGADSVFVRQWYKLSLIWKLRSATFTYLDKRGSKWNDRDEWIKARPAQDRSGSTSGQDNQRARQQADAAGIRRQGPGGSEWLNPEYEVVMAFHPWEIKGEERECVFFFCLRPQVLMGAFLLSDILWTGDRPLLEMHYQTVGTHLYSMGVMEICQHLSEELDAIHNMRMDVGFATNMPFFFYRASSGFNPDSIVLKPLGGVPVDDVNDVAFPHLANVTSFYAQEEVQLYSLIERVMGVTDLFLGVSPTKGAAARHATGFVGTQQEALARTNEILAQDANSASFLFRTIYHLELQYGPAYRMLRLEGSASPESQVSRDELRMRGAYDFRLGSNRGSLSSMLKQQQAQVVIQEAKTNPLIQQDPGRVWEATKFFFDSIQIPDAERFIGPRDAVARPAPKSPDRENAEMMQYQHGRGQPSPTHPNDDDEGHLENHTRHIQSPGYMDLGMPNQQGFTAHIQLHLQQKQQKQAQMQQAQATDQPGSTPGAGPGGQSPGGPGAMGGQDRIVPQLTGVDQMGGMGDLTQIVGTQPNSGGIEPPTLPGRG